MSDKDRDIEQRIQARAYQLWEAEGRPEGSAEEYWHRARELIEAETHSAYPPDAAQGAPNLEAGMRS